MLTNEPHIESAATAGEAAKGSARSALGAAAPWQETIVDGVRLAYDDAGTGPAIVCLHAIGHGARDFERIRRRFAERYRIVGLDWPGQGNSGPDPVAASAERYQELLAGFLDAARIERAVIIGNSIGGAAAIRYAAANPSRVRALVLENPGGLVPSDRTVRLATRAMARFFAAGARRAWWFPRLFGSYYKMVLPKAEAADARARIVAAGYEIAPILAQAWRSFGEPEADLRALAPRIECPVLFAWAKRDRIVRLKPCLPAIKTFPNARLETFEAGHAAHLEAPDAFETSLEEFLKSLHGAE